MPATGGGESPDGPGLESGLAGWIRWLSDARQCKCGVDLLFSRELQVEPELDIHLIGKARKRRATGRCGKQLSLRQRLEPFQSTICVSG